MERVLERERERKHLHKVRPGGAVPGGGRPVTCECSSCVHADGNHLRQCTTTPHLPAALSTG